MTAQAQANSQAQSRRAAPAAPVMTPARLRECQHCGQLQVLPPLPPASRVVCMRCEAVLRHTHHDPIGVPLALNITALIPFLVASSSVLLTVSRAGQTHLADLFTGPVGLEQTGWWELSAVVVFTTFAAPLAKVLAMIAVLVGVQIGHPPRELRGLFAWVERLRPWSMIEVYLLAVFVAYVRLGVLARIELGPALYALAGLMLTMVTADATLDSEAVWAALDRRHSETVRPVRQGWLPGAVHRLGCDTCHFVTRTVPGSQCPRCGFQLRPRKPDSIARTWALGVAALILYIPANVYPILTFTELGSGQPSTILGGVAELLAAGMWPLAALVFFASIVVPGLKVVGLTLLLLMTRAGSRLWLRDRTRLYRFIDHIGRWSMIDIFMGSLLVALLQFGSIVSVVPGPGALAFASVVILTMLAAQTFDPRLMWDAAGAQRPQFRTRPRPASDHPEAHRLRTSRARWFARNSTRRRRLSLPIWAIPIVSALIGGWLAWRTYLERGPTIAISFERASGLTAGQSHVRHKDVDMGLVEGIALSGDLQRVIVTVRMNREAKPLLTDKAQFWIVKPRFFAGALSGLETLVSGSYIELQPSAAGGQPVTHFVGLEIPPVLTSDVPGHTFLLQAPRLGNITLGSPVFYRDLDAGEVLGWDLGSMAETVTVHAFVRAPYDQYVHDNSRFWNDSGAKVSLGPNGLQLQVDSLRAVLLGGIAYDTPNRGRDFPISTENHVFPLYSNEDDADSAGFPRRVHFLAYFQGSIAGIAPDSAVTLHGIKIGEVLSVGLRYDKDLDRVVAPVHFAVEPDRIGELNLPTGGDLDSAIRDMVRRGLRVRLDSASLLTGQKRLAMDLYPDTPPATLTKQGDSYVIPVLAGGSEDITATAGALMAKLDAIPFQQIGDSLSKTLAGLSGLVNGPDLQQSIASLHTTLAGADTLVQHLNTSTATLPQRLPAIITELDSAAKRLNALVESVQSGYGGNTSFSRDANRLLLQLTDTARSFRVLADLLTRHPEALIRGRTDQGPD